MTARQVKAIQRSENGYKRRSLAAEYRIAAAEKEGRANSIMHTIATLNHEAMQLAAQAAVLTSACRGTGDGGMIQR